MRLALNARWSQEGKNLNVAEALKKVTGGVSIKKRAETIAAKRGGAITRLKTQIRNLEANNKAIENKQTIRINERGL